MALSTTQDETAALAAEALIEEARQRTRRRRRRFAAIALAVALAAGIGYLVTPGGSRPAPVPPRQPAYVGPAAVNVLNLSKSDAYESVNVVNGRLLLSGGPDGSLLNSASDAALPRPLLNSCHSAVVDPMTLKLEARRSGACENPALYGEHVLPINDVAFDKTNGSTLRIAIAEGAKRFRVGPVLLRYSEFGVTDAEWAYGPKDLWIYAPLTTHGAQLLRVSTTTGALLADVAMPAVREPILAANANGLYFDAPSGSVLTSAPSGLYFIGLGVSRPELLSRTSPDWIVASGTDAWTGSWTTENRTTQTLAHYVGGILVSTRRFAPGEPSFAGPAYGTPPSVAGADGIVTVSPFFNSIGPNQSLYLLDPATGSVSGLTRIALPATYGVIGMKQPSCYSGGQRQQDCANTEVEIGISNDGLPLTPSTDPGRVLPELPVAVLGHAAFVLDPPQHSPTTFGRFQGFSALYRIVTSRG